MSNTEYPSFWETWIEDMTYPPASVNLQEVMKKLDKIQAQLDSFETRITGRLGSLVIPSPVDIAKYGR